jgi:hypothetical protein
MGKRADAWLRLWRPELTQPTAFAARVQGRLDRMDLSPEDAARAALVQIVLKMAPDLPVHEKKPRHLAR